ncbi:hypothetical protein QFC22_004083 [Naganishia vaughanmartiniae]|uniref:Uncharacterized protein n=1 Tax=Naganishia vaughanmartiniae TaxID=1424756 RepID=A0ACC2X2A9_9TREE|nr:hypothetical protein QFC22_004083 [Naganishia vaughanmartiniae]
MPSAWKKDAAVSAEDILSSVKRRVKFDDDGNAEAVVDDDAQSEIQDDSEDSEEDEEGEELTPALDAAIMRTLAMIRKKDEGVYGSGNVLQEQLRRAEVEAQKLRLSEKKGKGKEKAFSLQDHQRIALLEGKLANPDDQDSPENLPETIIPLTHVQEERALREEVTKAFHTAIGDDEVEQEDDDDGFLVKRDRTDTEQDAEKEEYRRFLLANGGGEDEVRKLLGLGGDEDESEAEQEDIADDGEDVASKAPVDVLDANHEVLTRTEKSTRQKKDDDAFLMNYILNRGWIDTEDQPEASTSAPVLNPGKNVKAEGSTSHPWGELEDDEAFEEIAETFETAYNFRFEEPGAANIVSHPREIASAARRADDSRKLQRQAKAERKAAEKAKREEETKRLKGQKRRQIEKQLAMLKVEFGEDALDGLDLEGDWDEAKHEAALQKLIGAEDDDEKPTWDDIEGGEGADQAFEEAEEYDAAEEGQDYALPEDDEDAPLNMDADFLEVPDGEGGKKKKNKKNKKKDRKTKKEEDDEALVEADLGASLEERKAKLKDAVDEYENLDHEDMIGDLPTRFKYMKSAPNTYGLTPVEILLATDAELNDFLTVKHYAPYRHGSGVGAAGRGMGKRLGELKSKLATRRWGEEIEVDAKGFGKDSDKARFRDGGWNKNGAVGKKDGGESAAGGGGGGPPKKRMGKKERQRLKAGGEGATGGSLAVDNAAPPPTEKKRKHTDGDGDSTKRQKV